MSILEEAQEARVRFAKARAEDRWDIDIRPDGLTIRDLLGPNYKCKIGQLAVKVRDKGDDKALAELVMFFRHFRESWAKMFMEHGLTDREACALYDVNFDICMDRFCSANTRLAANHFNGYVVHSLLCRLKGMKYHKQLLSEKKRKGLRQELLAPAIRRLVDIYLDDKDWNVDGSFAP